MSTVPAGGGEAVRWSRVLRATAGALAVRPALWPVAVLLAVRLARPRWWARRPFLPVPDPAYWRFRMVTAYGGDGRSVPAAADVVAFMEWARGSRCMRGTIRSRR